MKLYLIRSFVLLFFVFFALEGTSIDIIEDGGSVLIIPKSGESAYEISIPKQYVNDGKLQIPASFCVWNEIEVVNCKNIDLQEEINLAEWDLPSGQYILVLEIEGLQIKRVIMVL